MAAEPREKPISLEEFAANAAALYERMQREGGSVVIEQGDLLFTVRPKRRARRRKGQFLPDDPLFEMAGIANSGGPGDVATNKHKYLADAYADLHDTQPS